MTLHRNISFALLKWKRSLQNLHVRSLATSISDIWEPTVGLEIHAQIATNSKLFSKASTKFASPVNSSVSLFDCAIPGTMPVLNKKCVEAAVLTALALSSDLNEVSMFERKHYFYADLPAGFQITQQKKPLAVNGDISFYVFTPTVHKQPYLKTSKLKQIQLEQDSGKSLHFDLMGKSLIDLNRAGIPLMELVFEPDLKDGEEAAALVKELVLILETLSTCSCKMEEGAIRVDANVSVAKKGEPLGTRTELKNIGSVRAVAAAIRYEIERQISILEKGENVINETRAWDVDNSRTTSLREKEEKLDYRFMPETNLPPLYLCVSEDAKKHPDVVDVPSIRAKLPSLPEDLRKILLYDYNMKLRTVLALMSNMELLEFFFKLKNEFIERDPQALANFLLNDLLTVLNKHKLGVSVSMANKKAIGEVFDMRHNREINLWVSCELLISLLFGSTKTPRQMVQENNWFMVTDKAILRAACVDIINKNQVMVDTYKRKKNKKKESLFRAIHRKVIDSVNKYKADSQVVSIILKELLDQP